MSAATASKASPAAEADAPPAAPTPRRKKLVVIVGAALLVLVAGGGAAAVLLKQRAAAAAEATDGDAAKDDDASHEAKTARAELKNAPTFTPLDPFTVNLADRDTERYAQVGITLELADAKAGDLLKAYMPAIRHNILLSLGSKTAAQMSARDDKVRLADELRREALRPLGYELKPSAATAAGDELPIRAVHFSNFIIQ